MVGQIKFPNGTTVTHAIKAIVDTPLLAFPSGVSLGGLILEKDLIMHASYHELKKMFLIYRDGKPYFVSEKDVEIIEKIKNSPLKSLQLLGFFVDKEKHIKLWRWKPSNSIQAFELAKFLPFLMTSGGVNAISEEELLDADMMWKDHFEISEIPEGAQNTKEYQEVRRKVMSGVYG